RRSSGFAAALRRRARLLQILGARVEDAREAAGQAVQRDDEAARGAAEAAEELRLQRLLVGDARQRGRVLAVEPAALEHAAAHLDLAALLDVGLEDDLRGVDRRLGLAPGERRV